jgi:4-hydroxy-tetrahydrodipicolinate reductase
MSTVRIALIGAKGRMGQAIVDLAKKMPDVEVVAQCDIGDSIEQAASNSDVLIDFSQASAAEEVCRVAAQLRRAVVIGTTGHSSEQRKKIEAAAKSVPIIFASNFSVGVNVLFWLTRKAAELVPEFQPEIIEKHHKMKKDAPSGTAKTLAEIVKSVRKDEKEIPIQSIREGDIVGEHTVTFAGPGEVLGLAHSAGSREIFARGALRASAWVAGKPPGLYSMQDVLGL